MAIMSVGQIALSGIRAAQTRLATVAHNLANMQTDGFQQQKVRLSAAAPRDVYPGAPGQVGQGVIVDDIVVDETPGPTVVTDDGSTRTLSNTDVAANLIEATLAEAQFKANVHVLRVEQSLFDELLSIRRR